MRSAYLLDEKKPGKICGNENFSYKKNTIFFHSKENVEFEGKFTRKILLKKN